MADPVPAGTASSSCTVAPSLSPATTVAADGRVSPTRKAPTGVTRAVNGTTIENGFVTDLGGGSIQVSQVVKRKMREAISLPLGAVRMTEQFLKSDPVSDKEMDTLNLQTHDGSQVP